MHHGEEEGEDYQVVGILEETEEGTGSFEVGDLLGYLFVYLPCGYDFDVEEQFQGREEVVRENIDS